MKKRKLLGIGAMLALAVAVTACQADEGAEGEIAKLRAKVKELETKNQALEAEVARLKDILYKVPATKPDQARLDKDLRALSDLNKALNEKPDDKAVLKEAAALAKQLGPHLPGNGFVWEILLKTRTLKDGLSLAEALLILGPPTDMSKEHAGWYFNPLGRHVAPYLRAKVTKEGLVDWTKNSR
jgi:hypothetical protein